MTRKRWPFINWVTNPLDAEAQVVKQPRPSSPSAKRRFKDLYSKGEWSDDGWEKLLEQISKEEGS